MSTTDAPAQQTYWNQTRRPLPCLIFLLPLLTLYEVGLMWGSQHGVRTDAVQNGADSWMRWGLEYLGLSPAFALPAVILSVFVSWQIWSRESWRLDGGILAGMLGESLALALALMVLGRIQDIAFHRMEATPVVAAVGLSTTTTERLVAYVGAGIYEETLFRLLLLPAVFYGLCWLGIPSVVSTTLAITASALAFSVAHHLGPVAEPFIWYSFIFRWLAGLFFAGVFVLRGFGIAVGAHAAYDILIGVLRFEL